MLWDWKENGSRFPSQWPFDKSHFCFFLTFITWRQTTSVSVAEKKTLVYSSLAEVQNYIHIYIQAYIYTHIREHPDINTNSYANDNCIPRNKEIFWQQIFKYTKLTIIIFSVLMLTFPVKFNSLRSKLASENTKIYLHAGSWTALT